MVSIYDMIIKEVRAREILDSRKDKTIEISVKTAKGNFISSAPEGKSKGRWEAKPYNISLEKDIEFINNLGTEENLGKIKISEFKDLKEIEGLVGNKLGANSLFVFEASILKALAAEQGEELWEFLSRTKKPKFPMPVGNAIGGGLHSLKFERKPDFQEFLFIPETKKFSEAVSLNRKAYAMAGKLLGASQKNDEGAWHTQLRNLDVLDVMEKIRNEFGEKMRIGIDAAASSFFSHGFYNYKNKQLRLNRKEQIDRIVNLDVGYELFYVEDPLEQEDFEGFSEITRKTKSLIVGDDLTVTSLGRLKRASQMKSINAIIIKPNQQGSLVKVKEICDFCRKNNIKIVFSHRSGETMDTTISDLALAWKADFIKCGIFGKEREAKLKQLAEIEKGI